MECLGEASLPKPLQIEPWYTMMYSIYWCSLIPRPSCSVEGGSGAETNTGGIYVLVVQ